MNVYALPALFPVLWPEETELGPDFSWLVFRKTKTGEKKIHSQLKQFKCLWETMEIFPFYFQYCWMEFSDTLMN